MQKGTDLPKTDKAIIIIGDPGTRKTTLALHFPTPFFMDCDGNMSAPVERTGIRDFYFASAAKGEDGELIHPLLRYQHCIKMLNQAAASPDVKTIVIDSLTSLTDIIISEVKRQEHGTAAVNDVAKDAADAKQFRIQDWGKFAYLIKNLITKLRTCGKIIVVTAHNNFEKDEVDSRFKQFINVPGQSKSTISGLFTDCWHTAMRVKGVGDNTTHEFVVRTLPVSDTDHRGVKSSFQGMKTINTFDEVIQILKGLK